MFVCVFFFQNMYFRMDSCPMQVSVSGATLFIAKNNLLNIFFLLSQAAADMQFCAAQGRDHREVRVFLNISFFFVENL